MDETDTKKEEG